jgi:D-psicose/D-tagatose/L-ribulose 3-epimerase
VIGAGPLAVEGKEHSMNKIGVHALVWAGSWGARECEYTVASSKEAGYDLVEFPVFQPAAMDIEAIQRALSANGMTATCSLGLSFDKDINSEDPACVARGEAVLSDALSAARDLGSPYLGGVIFSALGPYSSMPTERSRRNSIDAIRRLAEKAAPLGITLGLEFVNRYESNLLNTTAQTLDFIEEVGLPNVVVHADSYHMNIEENDFRSPILAGGSKIGYVHIGENHRGYLGSGHIDFAQLFGALAEIGYEGVITFESFSSAVVDADLSTILRIWRNVWSDGMDLAKQARGFIREQIGAAARA